MDKVLFPTLLVLVTIITNIKMLKLQLQILVVSFHTLHFDTTF